MNEVTLPKLIFFDPSDLRESHLKGNSAHLIFHADTIKDCMANFIFLTSTDPHYSKALPRKIDFEKLSPYFAFRPHDVIQHTLQQTTQLAKFITLCEVTLKVGFRS
jgi:hypothetical protein